MTSTRGIISGNTLNVRHTNRERFNRCIAHCSSLYGCGVQGISTIRNDLHAGQVQGFFHDPVDHMTALFLLADHFRSLHLDDLVVSPDEQGQSHGQQDAEREDASSRRRARPRDEPRGDGPRFEMLL